ncbi:MAG: hypothetical protein WCA06_18780, partial [Terrimicrobiaceae bacterium]
MKNLVAKREGGSCITGDVARCPAHGIALFIVQRRALVAGCGSGDDGNEHRIVKRGQRARQTLSTKLFTEDFLDVSHLSLDLPADFLGGSAIAHPGITYGFPNLFLQLARRLLDSALHPVL